MRCTFTTEILIVPTLAEIGDKEIFENDNVLFETKATGKPEPLVEWFHGFNKLKPSKRTSIDQSGNAHSLYLKECSLEQSGTVTAVASNKAGTCTVESSLLVKGRK